MSRTFAAGLAYAGEAFLGFQSQADGRAVQNALERAFAAVDADMSGFSAAGRTDTGVHATGQVIGFRTTRERGVQAWQRGLNAHLPPTVRVTWVREVDAVFHARFSATARRYLYVFMEGDADPLSRSRVTPTLPLDDAAMHRAAQFLVGECDFSSFRAAGCQSPTPFRRVNQALVRRHGPLVTIDVSANAFLLRMMRNIAGALARVGRGEWQPADFRAAMEARDRTRLGRTAAPDGLYLVDVSYPPDLLRPEDQQAGWPPGQLPPVLRSLRTLDRL
ncbi:MAG: tRNA pseudouridine(38-40) synthase TruA [Pseudomonadales bacterium]|nr:tRNA pseudouridine(38-40) synthase TruA [Pseudomonadales bacterium]MCP5183968.1 tRNA pseudouridine(38-40) synthase TruA [Pseudomonadales bacterium]